MSDADRIQVDLRGVPADVKQRLQEMADAKGLTLTAFIRSELFDLSRRDTTNVVVLQKPPWQP